ncbi:hypothetical protein [Leptospira sp. mild_001]|uniref:hypothetical protein n=1 Tax=Leptospira sp. mild_001 TaxID=2838238 RepID=UPI001E4CF989|nr:hypothetical protein [Leptospira sp. mild_001]
MKYNIILLISFHLVNCLYVLPFKDRVLIPEDSSSFLIFNYKGFNLNKYSKHFTLKADLRYKNGYMTQAYDLIPDNQYWRTYYTNPEDLPFTMRWHTVTEYTYFTEECEYRIPIPTGIYNLEIEFKSFGLTGYIKKSVDVKEQNSLYLDFQRSEEDTNRINLQIAHKLTKSKNNLEKCIYKD